MAKQLTKEGIIAVQNNPDLFAEVCKAMDVKPDSLSVILRRNSRRLTEHAVVTLIAKATGMRPSQIEEPRTKATAA